MWDFVIQNANNTLFLVSQEYSPSPLKNKNLVRTWDFEFSVAKNTPLPPENENLVRTWDFQFLVTKNIPTKCKFGQKFLVGKNTPLENENLVRTWDIKFSVAKNTTCPPPHPKWKFGQDLGLQFFGCQEYPPPPIEIWSELGTLSFWLPRIPSPSLASNVVGTGVWRLTTVSPNGYCLVSFLTKW